MPQLWIRIGTAINDGRRTGQDRRALLTAARGLDASPLYPGMISNFVTSTMPRSVILSAGITGKARKAS